MASEVRDKSCSGLWAGAKARGQPRGPLSVFVPLSLTASAQLAFLQTPVFIFWAELGLSSAVSGPSVLVTSAGSPYLLDLEGLLCSWASAYTRSLMLSAASICW